MNHKNILKAVVAASVLINVGFLFAGNIDFAKAKKELKDKTPVVRLNAVKALSQDVSDETVSLLVEQLKVEQDGYLKVRIIEVLGESRKDFVIDTLIAYTKDTNNAVKRAALSALDNFKDNTKVSNALSGVVVSETDESAKMTAIHSLRNQKDQKAVDTLDNAAAQSDNKNVKAAARHTLNRIDTDQAKKSYKKHEKIHQDELKAEQKAAKKAPKKKK